MSKDNNIHVSVSICGDKDIQELNKKFLKKDEPTDVLSFNVNECLEDGTFYLGDVIVNREQAKRQAKNYGNSVEEEISELVSHGILHLFGVDHK